MTKRTIKLPPGIMRMINNPVAVKKPLHRKLAIEIVVVDDGTCHPLCPQFRNHNNGEYYICELFGEISKWGQGKPMWKVIAGRRCTECRSYDPSDKSRDEIREHRRQMEEGE